MPKSNEKLTIFINFSIALIVAFFGVTSLRNNYLNTGACLGLTGALLILQILLSTFDFSNFKLARKDWFGLGTATILGLVSLWLTRSGILELSTNSYPQTTITYFFFAQVIFGVLVYLNRLFDLYRFAIITISINGLCAILLQLMQSYTPESQVFLLIQALLSYCVLTGQFLNIYSVFRYLTLSNKSEE